MDTTLRAASSSLNYDMVETVSRLFFVFIFRRHVLNLRSAEEREREIKERKKEEVYFSHRKSDNKYVRTRRLIYYPHYSYV